MRRPIAIDLFAGAGGLSLGFEQAGFDIAAAVEIDPIHCAIHHFNFPYSATICRSVKDIDGNEIRHLAGIGTADIDVVCGGAPCQGFSLIGKRAFDDPRNALVHHFVRLVLELNPKYFVFENVKGLTVGKHKQFLREIISAFTETGYNVLEDYQVLNAADYGVPQDRRRLFLLGARPDCFLPEYPAPLTPDTVRIPPALTEDELTARTTVWQAIGDLPEAEDYPALLERDWTEAEFKRGSAYARRLHGLDNASGNYGYRRCFDRNILTSSLRTEHTPLSKERFAATEFGKVEPVSRFLRLDPNGLCNTLRAGTASDRGAFTSPRPIHPYTPRCITVREAARLHSYPDWFRLHLTKWHGFRQIGNSVPPLLGQAVANQIMQALQTTPTVPKEILELGNTELLTFNMSAAAEFFGVSGDVIPKRTRIATKEVTEAIYA